MALAAQGNVEEARAAWQRALAQNPKFTPALEALATAG
jgi:predicted negative regulator of RcsB-dependent stress response